MHAWAEEALNQLELIDHDFYVYRDSKKAVNSGESYPP